MGFEQMWAEAERLQAEVDGMRPELVRLREENARLKTALKEMEKRLSEGLSCGIGPSTGEPLNQRERAIINGILKLTRAALVPEVK